MKHFIGGWAAGFILGMFTVEAGSDKPIHCFMVGLLVGVAAWGLLP